MKEINGYTLATVPDGFYGYSIVQLEKETILKISDRVGDYVTVIIPKGNYSIIGLAKDLTPEQKAETVEMKKTFGYRNYAAVNGEYQWTNLEKSFDSLLKANNLNPDTTLILKKIL